MSRGHGATQRMVLDKLAAHAHEHPPLEDFDGEMRFGSWVTIADLAEGHTRAARESARRAAIRLCDEGLVELLIVARGGYGRRRMHLCARMAPDEATRLAWDDAWTRYRELRAQAWASLVATREHLGGYAS